MHRVIIHQTCRRAAWKSYFKRARSLSHLRALSIEYALLTRSPAASNIDTSLDNKDLEQREKLKLDDLYIPYL